MAKRLRDVCALPESEPLWRAGRGFVVRDLPWTVEKLRVIPQFEFENWADIALGGIPNKVQVGDMGVDEDTRAPNHPSQNEFRKRVPVHLHLNFTRRVVCTRLQPSNGHFLTYKQGPDISATHFRISGIGFLISGIQFRIYGNACRIFRMGFSDMGTAGLISGVDFLSLGNICRIYGNDFPLSGRVGRIHGNVRRLSGIGSNPFPAPRRNGP